MSSVDDRIVNMQWNSKQFTQGASESQKALQSVDSALANTAKGTGLSSMGSQVDGIAGKFSAMKVVGVTALATIASKATSAGLNVIKSLALDPITQGFQEYQTNLNSIQTIMANTGKSVSTVNVYLQQLNHYSDQTIYNFSQMADAIGKFTSAGVPLKDATDAIKGMANTAALSGSSVQQLNTAMYQMSQALSTGTIRLMDWNSLANAGMGGSNIREALMATNRTLGDHGAAMDEAIKANGSFRDSLQAGWLSAETFNKTMKVMAGQTVPKGDKALKLLGMSAAEFKKSGLQAGQTVAFTVKQLKEMGYSQDAAKTLNKLSQASIESATKVKTASQALDVVKESIGSGFGKIFQDLFGNFNQASKLWTGVTTSITNAVARVFGSVDKMLIGWRKLGGYQDLWTGFGNIFKTIGNLMAPFVAAFKTLLPSTGQAGSNLAALTSGFAAFTGWMEKVSRGASVLTPILVSIFSVFGKIAGVVGAVIQGLAPLAPLLEKIGSSINDMAKQGAEIASGLIGGLVSGLNADAIRQAIVNLANNIVTWAKGVLGIHSPSTVFMEIGTNIIEGLVKGLQYALSTLIPAIAKGAVALVTGFAHVMGDIIQAVSIAAPKVGDAFSVIFEHVAGLFAGFDSLDWAALFNAILTGGLIYAIKKSVDAVTSFRDLMGSTKEVIEGVGDSLKVWQQSLKAKMILEIALAIGILTVSVIALSLLNPKQLAVGLGAIATMMGMLAGSLAAINKVGGDKQIAILATSMVLISGAMIQLAGAVAIFGNMDMSTLAKGLGAMGIALGIMVKAMQAMTGIKGQLVAAGAAIVLISFAMTALAGAVAAFGVQDMAQLAKGLGAMGIALGLVVGAIQDLSANAKGTLAGAASIVMVSVAMTAMAAAVLLFGKMDMKTLAKGLLAMAAGLGIMTGVLLALSGNAEGVLAAAGAMVLMATAMNILLSVILTLGAAPWQVVVKGLLFVAAALGIFLLAALAAAAPPVAAGLAVLGTALFAIGAGLALAGAGMFLFASGWAIMAAAGVAGTAVIVAAIHVFLALLPEIARQMAASFVAFLKVIANATGEIRAAFDKIFKNMIGVVSDNIPILVALVVKFVVQLLKGIQKIIPEFGRTISTLIKTGLDIFKKAIPQYIAAGETIVLRVLQGLGNKIPKMLDAAGDLIVKFIEGLGNQANKIVDAAGRTILKFLEGIDRAVNKYSSQITAMGGKIAADLVSGVVKGLLSSLSWTRIKSAVESLASAMPGWAKKVLGINSPSKVFEKIGHGIGEGMAAGVRKSTKIGIDATIKMANAIIAAGNKAVARAQKQARGRQTAAYRAQAQADIKADEAREAAKFARQNKKDKAAQRRAKRLQQQADKSQKHADKAQAIADRAAQHVQDTKTFQEADLHGKGDIKNEAAVQLSDRANQVMQKANAESDRAHELMKTNRKAARALLAQAEKDAKRARELAKQARQAHKDANKYYAQEVNDRIKQMQDDAAADEKAKKDQEAYDAADAQGKSDILNKRADANEAKADALKKQAAAWIAQAKRLAKTDAAKAMKLLDQAQQATEDAQAAADQAADERKQAEQVLTEGNSTTSGGGSTGGGTIQPSKSILEDAASAVDRYTASLQEAMALQAAQQGVMQFVQNNYSPEALSAAEIYRQGKNLVSAAEIKMGANPNP